MQIKQIYVCVIIMCFDVASVSAQRFDPEPVWPLCGRISEAPPRGWLSSQGCPPERWGNTDATDLPLSSTFGPRQKASEQYRYDYHRGIDIPAAVGTPVFAVTGGEVRIAGSHPSYSDTLVQIRHFRPGYSSCDGVGCYISNYLHLSSIAVAEGQWVNKGELIGYTGSSVSGFAHLHFEIRDAPATDPHSAWQRDAIHPLGVLPYHDDSGVIIYFDDVDTSNPGHPVVDITVSTPRLDIVRVEITVYNHMMNPVTQAGNMVDAYGYHVFPSWFDIELWNFEYTHKDSQQIPWSSFAAGGVHECPFHDEHGTHYEPNVHLDRPASHDTRAGEFNGIIIAPAPYNASIPEYELSLGFHRLRGPARCIKARVWTAVGDQYLDEWGTCNPILTPVPTPPVIQH